MAIQAVKHVYKLAFLLANGPVTLQNFPLSLLTDFSGAHSASILLSLRIRLQLSPSLSDESPDSVISGIIVFLLERFLFGGFRFRLLGIMRLEVRNSGVGIDRVSTCTTSG